MKARRQVGDRSWTLPICPHNMDTKRKNVDTRRKGDPISTRSLLPTSCWPTITIQNVDMSASESSRSSTSGASQGRWTEPSTSAQPRRSTSSVCAGGALRYELHRPLRSELIALGPMIEDRMGDESVGATVVPWSNDAMGHVRVTEVGPTASDQLLAWNALLRDGFNAGREAAWWASGETTLARFENPRPGRHSVLLTASLDGRPAGAAGAEADPGEPAAGELSVLPPYRRRGVGRALARAVRERLTGRAEAAQAETYSEAGVEFGRALG